MIAHTPDHNLNYEKQQCNTIAFARTGGVAQRHPRHYSLVCSCSTYLSYVRDDIDSKYMRFSPCATTTNFIFVDYALKKIYRK